MPPKGTLARRPPEIHSLRSRHSRAAASPPASLPALTVPRRVRLGRAPRRTWHIDPLDARPLQERTSGCRGAPLSNGRDLRPLAAVPLAAISSFGGTLLNVRLDIGMSPLECPREHSKNSATWIALLPIRKEERRIAARSPKEESPPSTTLRRAPSFAPRGKDGGGEGD